MFTVCLGGDHSITLAELRAIARRHGPLALAHLDAHGDTWEAYFGQRYFHGTTFKRAAEEGLIDPNASVQAGMRGSLYGADDIEDARRMGFHGALDQRSAGARPAGLRRPGADSVLASRPLFLSFDVDFVDPAYTPGTGTPEVAGPTSGEAISFVRALTGVNIVGADVVEVAPAYDGPGQATALLAATVAWEILSLYALRRRDG